jgi:4-amino-4-deoxy-L-arabinose transferase-like glycosyltransferase
MHGERSLSATQQDQSRQAYLEASRPWRFALAATALLTGLRLFALFATPLELYPDEAQYWLWSRSLDLGYFSKPPMIAWVIHLTTAIGGDSEPWVRIAAPLFHAVTGLTLFAVGRRLYGPWAGVLALLTYQLMPGVAVANVTMTTDTPLLCFLSIALLAYVDLPTAKRPLFTAAGLGAALGLGMLSKYAAIYAVIGIVLHLIVSRQARSIWRPATALVAAGVFALVIAPNLIWNALNGFETVQHTAANADLGSGIGFNVGGLLQRVVFEQFGVFGLAFGVLIAAWVLAARRRLTDEDILLVCWTIPPFVVVGIQALLSRANANWAAAAYIPAAVLVGGLVVRWWPSLWTRIGVGVTLVVQGLVVGFLVLAIASPAIADAVGRSNDIKRMRGWKDVVDATVQRAQVEQADQGLTAVAVDSRFLFNAMAYYGRDYFGKPGAPPLTIWLRRDKAGNQAEARHPLTPAQGRRVLAVVEDEVRRDADGVAKMAPRIALVQGDFARSELVGSFRAGLDRKRVRRAAFVLGEDYRPRPKP